MILVCLPSFGIAQKHKDTLISLPMKDGKVFYDKIYQDSGFSKNDLYIKAKNVFLRLFPATKDVIQNEDKENGIISGKGYFSFYNKGGLIGSTALIKTTINIVVKDNKYKAEVFDFYNEAKSAYEAEGPIENFYALATKKYQKYWYGYFTNFNSRVILLLAQINDEMGKKLITDF